MKIKKPSLAFVCPAYGPIHSRVYKSHLAAIANASRTFDVAYVGVTEKQYLHTASNILVENALEHCIDYIFWTEADMLLPFNTIERLYQDIKRTDLEAVGGLYFLRGDGTQPCLYKKLPQNPPYNFTPVILVPENELFRIDCCGFGGILLKTDIFRKMEYPWFDLKEGGYGQDIYFCEHAKRKGIRIGCDSSVLYGHLGEPEIIDINCYNNWIADTQRKTKGGIILTAPQRCIDRQDILKQEDSNG